MNKVRERTNKVLTTMVREGISIRDHDYPPMSLNDAIDLYYSLCFDCRNLIAGAVDKGLENDYTWQTMYDHYQTLADIQPIRSKCVHCSHITKPLPIELGTSTKVMSGEESISLQGSCQGVVRAIPSESQIPEHCSICAETIEQCGCNVGDCVNDI